MTALLPGSGGITARPVRGAPPAAVSREPCRSPPLQPAGREFVGRTIPSPVGGEDPVPWSASLYELVGNPACRGAGSSGSPAPQAWRLRRPCDDPGGKPL